jgi:hypothetical protein
MEGFKWYRKSQGGTWYKVRNTQMQPVAFYWVRHPSAGESIIETECY